MNRFRPHRSQQRLEIVTMPRRAEGVPGLRTTDNDRQAAARRLAAAQRDGRFGTSDLYEQRMEDLLDVTTHERLSQVVGDLDDLVPESLRGRLLQVIAGAHADGRLDLSEFTTRTDRCFGPLTCAEADRLVADLGYRVRPHPRRRRTWTRVKRLGLVAGAGGALGTTLVAVPAALDLPGPVSAWLPLAVGTGAFCAVGSVICAVAWLARGRGRMPPGASGNPLDADHS